MASSDSHRLRHIYHRRHARYLLMAAALYAMAYLVLFEPWDGGGSAAEVVTAARLASLLRDGDLDLADEFLDSRNTAAELGDAPLRLTARGFVADVWPVGATFMHAPFWLAAHRAVQWISGDPPSEPFGQAYRLAVSLASLLYGLFALLLIWRTACRFVSSRTALAATVLTFFGSMAVTACFRRPAFPYASAVAASALFLYVCVCYAPYARVKEVIYVGLTGGLMVLTDWFSAPFLVLPLLMAMRARVVRPWEVLDRLDRVGEGSAADPPPGKAWKRFAWRAGYGALRLLITVVCLFASASLQLIVWRRLTGAWLVRPDPTSGLQPIHSTDALQDFLVGLPPWSFDAWFRGFFGELHGLLQWYPCLAVGMLGLLFMALRRRVLGAALGAAVVAATAVAGFGVPIEPVGAGAPARMVFLIPFLTLGAAWFLHEGRSPAVRAAAFVVFLPGIAWNLIVTLAADRSALFAAPLSGGWHRTMVLLRAFLDDPSGYLADSLLARYLGLGYPVPLETLVALLVLFFLIPAGAWVGLRYALPVLRRRHGLKGIVAVSLAGLGLFGVMVWQSVPQPIGADVRGKLRDVIREGALAADELTSGTFAGEELAAYALVRPGWQFDSEERRAGAARLADMGFYVGYAGLLEMPEALRSELAATDDRRRDEETQRAIEERLPAALWLSGRSANGRVAERAALILDAAGRREEAVDWVEGSFLPSAVHWRVRGLLARPGSQQRLHCLVLALTCAPLEVEGARALWKELRHQDLPGEADRLAGRYVPVAQSRLRLLSRLQERYRDAIDPHHLEDCDECTRFVSEVARDRSLERLRGLAGAGRDSSP